MTDRLTDEQIDWLLGLVGSATLRVMCGDRLQYSTEDLVKVIHQLRKERDEFVRALDSQQRRASRVRNAALEEAAKVAREQANVIMDEFHLSGVMPSAAEMRDLTPIAAGRRMLGAYTDLVRRFEEGMPAAIRELKDD